MTRVAMSNKPRICSVSSNSSATTISTSNAFYVQLHSERASSKLPPQPRLKSHMKDIFDGQASAEILGLGAIPYGADVGEVTGAFRAACARADQRLRESCDTNPLWYDSSIQPFDPVEKERCDRWLLLAASNYSALVASSLDMNDTHATKGCCFESKPTSSASSSYVEGTICDPEFCLGRIPSKSERFDLSVEDFSHREDEKDIHHGINIQTEIIRTFVASDLRADYRNAMIR